MSENTETRVIKVQRLNDPKLIDEVFVEMGEFQNAAYEFEADCPLYVDESGTVWAEICNIGSVPEKPVSNV